MAQDKSKHTSRRVSIRSPRRSEGRCKWFRCPTTQHTFQSAPPAEARGDVAGPAAWPPLIDVSIRSPRRSEGRFCDEYDSRPVIVFQSAPPAEARGDKIWHWGEHPDCLFQSAPPAEARGDQFVGFTTSATKQFQSAPPAEARGDGVLQGVAGWFRVVSIRSPRRSEGR